MIANVSTVLAGQRVERFDPRFASASLIDNQAIEDQFLPEFDELPLLDFYGVMDVHAITRTEGVIAASRMV